MVLTALDSAIIGPECVRGGTVCYLLICPRMPEPARYAYCISSTITFALLIGINYDVVCVAARSLVSLRVACTHTSTLGRYSTNEYKEHYCIKRGIRKLQMSESRPRKKAFRI